MLSLFSSPTEPASHRTRIVLAEKDVEIEIISVTPGRFPEDLLDLNPDNSLPTLVDRDLVLYDSRVVIDYLDERYPHPPMMPIDPVSRAQFRIALLRIERDWYRLAATIDREGKSAAADQARTQLRDLVMQTAEVLKVKPFFLSDEFSMVDASIAPILWRLPHYGIEVPKDAVALTRYMRLVFNRPSFRQSLSPQEREMRLA
jgi:RNA polymerase-associated protein